jgi:opacity protein-like surface antigen
MNRYGIFLLLILLVMTPLAAVASDFQGPLVEVGITRSNTETDVDFPNWFQTEIDATSINGRIAVGYGHRFGRCVLAGQLYYTLGNQESGSTTQRYQETAEVSTLSFELDNSWGIALQPGVVVNDATLVYLRLGYARTTGEWTLERPYYRDRYSDRLDFDGYSLGAGIKRQLLPEGNPHLYGFVAIEKVWYRQESTAVTIAGSSFVDDYQPATLSVTLGVGWQF